MPLKGSLPLWHLWRAIQMNVSRITWGLAAYCIRSQPEISQAVKTGAHLHLGMVVWENALPCLNIDVLKLLLFMNASRFFKPTACTLRGTPVSVH